VTRVAAACPPHRSGAGGVPALRPGRPELHWASPRNVPRATFKVNVPPSPPTLAHNVPTSGGGGGGGTSTLGEVCWQRTLSWSHVPLSKGPCYGDGDSDAPRRRCAVARPRTHSSPKGRAFTQHSKSRDPRAAWDVKRSLLRGLMSRIYGPREALVRCRIAISNSHRSSMFVLP
jgi:hypothetical protein